MPEQHARDREQAEQRIAAAAAGLAEASAQTPHDVRCGRVRPRSTSTT
jgi:hypothetical protein